MSDESTDIAELLDKLKNATECLTEASKETRHARINETNALNEVNRLQNRLDKALEAVRNEAPYATDWKESQRRSRGEQQ